MGEIRPKTCEGAGITWPGRLACTMHCRHWFWRESTVICSPTSYPAFMNPLLIGVSSSSSHAFRTPGVS